MAKLKITENSPLTIELIKDDGSKPIVLHRGDIEAEMKDFRIEKLSRREVVIGIGKG